MDPAFVGPNDVLIDAGIVACTQRPIQKQGHAIVGGREKAESDEISQRRRTSYLQECRDWRVEPVSNLTQFDD